MHKHSRAVITLLALPLCAFYCYPSPSNTLLIRPPKEQNSISSYPESDEGKAVLIKLRMFAKQFDLAETDCRGSWPSFHGAAPCYAFTRFRDEGIGLYFTADLDKNFWKVLLVKESRVFGAYSVRDVEANFDVLVEKPIVQALGESRAIVK